MKRRTILATAGYLSAGVAGCLGARKTQTDNRESDNRESDNRKYEKCGLTFVSLHSLPAPAKEEANAAIMDGTYETDDDLILSEVINPDSTYLYEEHGETYYNVSVTTDSGITRLYIEETRPKKAGLPEVDNKTETTVTVDIRVESQGEQIFNDTVDLAAGAKTDLDDGTKYGYGQYQATLTVTAGNETREKVITWRTDHIHGFGDIIIAADSIRMTDGPSAMIEGCEWNDEGELVIPNNSHT